MDTNLPSVMRRAYSWKGRSKKEAATRNRQFQQRVEYRTLGKSRNKSDGQRKASRARKPLPEGALEVWRTADPVLGAPSPQHVYCSSLLGVISICLCIPELSVALGLHGRVWINQYMSWAPQGLLGVSIVCTVLSVCCSSRCCMALASLASFVAVPAAVVQLSLIAVPAVMSFCCCFPDKCHGDQGSISAKMHIDLPEHERAGNATICKYVDHQSNAAECAKQSYSIGMFWSGVALMVVSSAALVTSQWHWRSEKVWLARSQERIRESRRVESSSEDDYYSDDDESGSENNSDDDDAENALVGKDKRKKTRRAQGKKNKSGKKTVQFKDENDESDGDEKGFGSMLSDQGRKEELGRLLELAKRKPPRSARSNRSGSRSARLPSTSKNQFVSRQHPQAPQTARPWKKPPVPPFSSKFNHNNTRPPRAQSARASNQYEADGGGGGAVDFVGKRNQFASPRGRPPDGPQTEMSQFQ